MMLKLKIILQQYPLQEIPFGPYAGNINLVNKTSNASFNLELHKIFLKWIR